MAPSPSPNSHLTELPHFITERYGPNGPANVHRAGALEAAVGNLESLPASDQGAELFAIASAAARWEASNLAIHLLSGDFRQQNDASTWPEEAIAACRRLRGQLL